MKFRKTKPTSPAKTAEKNERPEAEKKARKGPNPPHTTTGWVTSPKFGSAGSGGAEFEGQLDVD
ncbi:MAG: hypothetical protein ACYC3L_07155 [Gemmatimonadaceae bacterium]